LPAIVVADNVQIYKLAEEAIYTWYKSSGFLNCLSHLLPEESAM